VVRSPTLTNSELRSIRERLRPEKTAGLGDLWIARGIVATACNSLHVRWRCLLRDGSKAGMGKLFT